MLTEVTYCSVVDGCYTVIADLSEEARQVITDSEREEENYKRRKRYHHVISLDGVDYESKEMAKEMDLLNLVFERMETEKVLKTLDKLSENQKRRLMMYASGYTYQEIANIEHISVTAAYESVQSAQNKFEKLYNQKRERS